MGRSATDFNGPYQLWVARSLHGGDGRGKA